MPPFHLAFPVHDLDATRDFYGRVLGCPMGRSAETWQDFDLFGHQMSAHVTPRAEAGSGAVDGKAVPIPHFGAVLPLAEWEALAARVAAEGVAFLIEPQLRFAGQPGEQGTFFVCDPSGNALEFKGFRDMEAVFRTDMAIGIDFGGTKIEGVHLGPDGEERARIRVATPRHDYPGTVRAIADLVRRVEAEAGAPGDTVGVGIPGSLSPRTGFVRNSNAVWLHGHALDRDLSKALARPVRVENDANCFALSEATDGAGAGAASVFGVILGTGVGGGIVVGGRIVSGANGIGGEWGHIPLVAETADELLRPRCFCGHRGCLEMWLSGTGLARDFAEVAGAGAEGPDAREIAELATEGDPEAEAALARHRARLARMLGVIVNVLDPEVIVLGGGLSNLPGLAEGLARDILPHVFADGAEIAVRRARHGDSSGVRGAARLGAQV